MGPMTSLNWCVKFRPYRDFVLYSSVFCLFFIRTLFLVFIVLRFAFKSLLTTHNRQTSIPPPGYEPAIPAAERQRNLVLDRSATGIGIRFPDRPARRLSLHRLSYLDRLTLTVKIIYITYILYIHIYISTCIRYSGI